MESESEVRYEMNVYDYPYPQPTVPNYFNTNYMPPQQPQQQFQMQQPVSQETKLIQVPDELTAMNAQFPMDGRPIYFINANGGEIYSKQLSMVNGSVIFRRFKQVEDSKPAEAGYVTHAEMNRKIDEIYQLLGTMTAPATTEGSEQK